MSAQFKLRFSLKTRDGKGYIRVRVSYSGKYYDALTGFCAEPCSWDGYMQRIRPRSQDDKEVNIRLSAIETALQDLFDRCILSDGNPPDIQNLKDTIAKASGKFVARRSDPKLVSNVIIDFIKEQSDQKEWAWATIQRFMTMRNHLSEFNPKLMLSDFRNEETMKQFSDYLMMKGLRNVTVRKDLKLVCWFLRWAERRRLVSDVIYPEIKYKGTEEGFKKIIFLRPEELIMFHEYQYAVDSLARVRDVFCFCCFTGLRYSDVAKLKTSDINGDSISIVTQKTNDRIVIELNRYSKEILQRYGSLGCENRSLPALPVVSNQKMNVHLKEAAKLAGLDRMQDVSYYKGSQLVPDRRPLYDVITTHCARRTFVVMAMWLGIPLHVIQRWTGHSTIRAMQPYMDVLNEMKRSEMSKFDKITDFSCK